MRRGPARTAVRRHQPDRDARCVLVMRKHHRELALFVVPVGEDSLHPARPRVRRRVEQQAVPADLGPANMDDAVKRALLADMQRFLGIEPLAFLCS